jgi:hypothetical protein
MDARAAEQARKLPRDVLISLAETDAFAAQLTLPRGEAGAHVKAIQLRLGDLAPQDPVRLQIATTAIETNASGTTYVIAMARGDRLDQLERAARKKGARRVRFRAPEGDAVNLTSPLEDRRLRRGLIRDTAIALGLLASIVAAVMAWTARIENETRLLSDQERGLRRAAVAVESARREAVIAQNFVNRGILNRRAGAVLDTLAVLNTATPNGAWWTSVKWAPQETSLSERSGDPTRTIEEISKEAKSWTVELSGPLGAATGEQPQNFELRLRPREAAAQ